MSDTCCHCQRPIALDSDAGEADWWLHDNGWYACIGADQFHQLATYAEPTPKEDRNE